MLYIEEERKLLIAIRYFYYDSTVVLQTIYLSIYLFIDHI